VQQRCILDPKKSFLPAGQMVLPPVQHSWRQKVAIAGLHILPDLFIFTFDLLIDTGAGGKMEAENGRLFFKNDFKKDMTWA
jgi:hypothetical protein